MRDYANKDKRQRKRIRPAVIVGVLTVLLPLSFLYFRYREAVQGQVSPDQVTQTFVIDDVEPPQGSRKATEYAFYTLLPKIALSQRGATKQWVLQVASLQESTDAKRLQQRLKQSGYNAFVRQSRDNVNVTWYRVLTGPYATEQAAQAAQTKLAQKKLVSALVK